MKFFLIVAENKGIFEIYKLLLKRMYDAEVDCAYNGKDALEKIQLFKYDLIISDIEMPIMNGIDFHKALKIKSPILARKTVFISDHPHKLDLAYILEENIPYLPKISEKDSFHEMIDAVLEAEDNRLSVEFGNGCQKSHERIEIREENELKPVTKILLVDDVNISLEMGKIALSNSGTTVLTACNGREALDIVRKERPNIVLCDIYMPEMNGDELCETIKADPSIKNIPVILFSSYSDDKDTRTKYFRSGCDDILVKPYQKQELLNMIRKHANISTREHDRLPVEIEVNYLVSGETVSGSVVDMSIGGMLVKSQSTIPLNTDITFTVFIDGYENGTATEGRVVWSDEQFMGIQFRFTPNHIENLLAKVA